MKRFLGRRSAGATLIKFEQNKLNEYCERFKLDALNRCKFISPLSSATFVEPSIENFANRCEQKSTDELFDRFAPGTEGFITRHTRRRKSRFESARSRGNSSGQLAPSA